jgi:hypothetical protein
MNASRGTYFGEISVMTDRQLQKDIAEAIISARILRIPTARGAYEHSIGNQIISDKLWAQLEEQWEWHWSQPQSVLEGRS